MENQGIESTLNTTGSVFDVAKHLYCTCRENMTVLHSSCGDCVAGVMSIFWWIAVEAFIPLTQVKVPEWLPTNTRSPNPEMRERLEIGTAFGDGLHLK